ncbi:MAG: hypothetical protein Q9167_003987 [Letrouitia subvulpina]
MASFSPKVGDLEILGTTKSSVTFEAKVNITNPTEYSATVPFVNIHMLVNDTILGHATAENISVVPGPNCNIPVIAVWNPSKKGGRTGFRIGEELLSQYVSGYNTSLTLKTHAGTIPSRPHLGRALSKFSVSIPTPHLPIPKNPNHPDDGNDGDDADPDSSAPRFIDDATMHILTSTATLTLLSPLRRTTLYIETINATAFYDGDAVGQIIYDVPFAVPPGPSTTPRLPVDWSLGSVGFDAVKKALGGRLKVEAFAEAGIRVGEYRVDVWYEGHGIGAHVRV